MTKSVFSYFALMAMLVGCASVPDYQYTYYLPTTSAKVEVRRTVSCTVDDQMVAVDTVKVTDVHTASAEKRTLLLSNGGAWANLSSTIEYTSDGRLKSVGSTHTGKGKEVVSAVTTLLEGFKSFRADQQEKACVEIHGPKDKRNAKATATIDYTGTIENFSDSMSLDLNVDQIDAVEYPETVKWLGPTTYKVTRIEKRSARLSPVKALVSSKDKVASSEDKTNSSEDKTVLTNAVHFREPAQVKSSVTLGWNGNPLTDPSWTGVVRVAQLGDEVIIPLAKPGAFGTSSSTLTFDDSGAITKVAVTQNTGAADALTAATSFYDAVTEDQAERIKQLKADADEIAAEQKLARCLASPEDCK